MALGREYAANAALAALPDFQEGVACATGEKKGRPPQWMHASVEEAAKDPKVQAVLAAVRDAEPLTLPED